MLIENDPNELLEDALAEQDIDALKTALAAGANPDDIVGDDTTPIWWKNMEVRFIQRHIANKTKFQNDAWDLMIPLVHVTDYRLPDLRFADCPDHAPTVHISSTILLKALLEDPEFRLNLDVIFCTTSNDANVLKNLFFGSPSEKGHFNDQARKELRTKLLSIHRQVGLRLTNPFSAFEKQVVEKLTETQKSYWCQEMAFPPLDELPMPSAEYLETQQQLLRNFAIGHQTLQRTMTQGWASTNDKKVIEQLTERVRAALENMNQMRTARISRRRFSRPADDHK